MEKQVSPKNDLVMTDANAAVTIYYDGACPVCSREIALYRRQAGAEQCAWVDASSCTNLELGAGLTRDAALARFHVRRADGVLVDGVQGFAAMWRALPRFAWAGRIASWRILSGLLDTTYRIFLRIRPLWQSARTAPSEATTPRSTDPANGRGGGGVSTAPMAEIPSPSESHLSPNPGGANRPIF